MNRWLKIIDENGITDISHIINNFIFINAKCEYPISAEETINKKGVDGELPSAVTFAPFNLMVDFGLDGYDEIDLNLLEHIVRRVFFRRKPYYIVSSVNPGMKYWVNNPNVSPNYLDSSAGQFELTFKVYKGYAESIKGTMDINFLSDNWQFEGGLITDRDISYKHNNKRFSIWNGSDDTIDPLNHKLNIRIKTEAPNGFKMTNHMTGETFEYYGYLKKGQTLTLIGVNPIIGNRRIGIQTNFEWITLVPGMNNIEIEGNGVRNVYTEFEFNFIYR